jgi:hypothetical protein
MPNRRLCDLLVLLASALLETALRLLQRPAPHGWPWRPAPRLAAAACAWLAALAATAAAATSAPADLPPAARAARDRPLEIACPARMEMPWPSRLLDAAGQQPAAGVLPHLDGGRPRSALPAVVASAGAARPPTERLAVAQPLRASFYRGDPRALDVLSPGATHRSGDVETSTWNFADDAEMPVWIACVYRGDEVLATRPLPTGTRACTARLRITPMGDPAGLLAVSCR